MSDPVDTRSPSVSVIVPVYENPKGAGALLESLRHQSYRRFEVVIVDNGSSPALALEQEFPFKVRIFRCLTPGSYAARNAGACMANGDIFAFTDSDCVPDPRWIENAVRELLTRNGKFIIGGDVEVQPPERGTWIGLYQFAVGFQPRENVELKGFAATANLFCTLDQFRRVGPFDERLFSGADREWAWRASGLGFKFAFCREARVQTPPRLTLRSAIQQARRVTAGRQKLKALDLPWTSADGLAPHRNPLQGMSWIIRNKQFSWAARSRILAAAIAVKTATVIEQLRLRLGSPPERK
jgi:glycosyltransferase involved in cell wall biosynthesis